VSCWLWHCVSCWLHAYVTETCLLHSVFTLHITCTLQYTGKFSTYGTFAAKTTLSMTAGVACVMLCSPVGSFLIDNVQFAWCSDSSSGNNGSKSSKCRRKCMSVKLCSQTLTVVVFILYLWALSVVLSLYVCGPHENSYHSWYVVTLQLHTDVLINSWHTMHNNLNSAYSQWLLLRSRRYTHKST
jgi:hypothetical protein